MSTSGLPRLLFRVLRFSSFVKFELPKMFFLSFRHNFAIAGSSISPWLLLSPANSPGRTGPSPLLGFFSARPRDEICGESSPCDVVGLWSTTFNFSLDPSLPFSNNKILSSSPLSVFDLLTSAREKRGEKAICYTRPGFEKKHTHCIWDLFK